MTFMQKKWRENPYRILFVIGALASVLGVWIWLLFFRQDIGFYPREAHAGLMYFGFLYSFVVGFLFTAIPRMTKTAFASGFELMSAAFTQSLLVVFAFLNMANVYLPLAFMTLLQIVFFIAKRARNVKSVPFHGFYFIPAAIGFGLAGFIFYFMDRSTMGQLFNLSGEAFILNLVFGLGSRLIPYISGLVADDPTRELNSGPSASHYLITLIGLNLGYVIGFWHQDIGRYVTLAGSLWGAITLFKLHVSVNLTHPMKAGLKAAIVFLILGQVFRLEIFGMGLAGGHFLYIGGLALVTLMISTRVLLAHGAVGLQYESQSRRLRFLVVAVSIAAVFRGMEKNTLNSTYILLAAAVYSVAVIIWALKYLSIELRRA